MLTVAGCYGPDMATGCGESGHVGVVKPHYFSLNHLLCTLYNNKKVIKFDIESNVNTQSGKRGSATKARTKWDKVNLE